MAKRKTLTAAEQAAAKIESIKAEARALVTGWQQRKVTRDEWHEAHDLLAAIYPLSPAQWEEVEETLCKQYEAWREYRGLSHPIL